MKMKEYEENRAYLRHLEELRIKQAEFYLVVFGASLGVVAFLAKELSQGLQPLLQELGSFVSFLFFFDFIYGLLLCAWLARQKASYEYYRGRNAVILGTPTNAPSRKSSVFLSPFLWWLTMVVLINAAALFLALLSIALPLSWALIIAGIVVLLECAGFWKLSKFECVPEEP